MPDRSGSVPIRRLFSGSPFGSLFFADIEKGWKVEISYDEMSRGIRVPPL